MVHYDLVQVMNLNFYIDLEVIFIVFEIDITYFFKVCNSIFQYPNTWFITIGMLWVNSEVQLEAVCKDFGEPHQEHNRK